MAESLQQPSCVLCWNKDGSTSLWGHSSILFVSSLLGLLLLCLISLVCEQLKEAEEENDFASTEGQQGSVFSAVSF